jgi:transcriptional regulator with XRE-family HTH domain
VSIIHNVIVVDKTGANQYTHGMDHKWIYPVIGDRVRQRRKRFKLKQEALAARVGMSRASLANIETGRQNVLIHQLYALAVALDLSPKDLLPDKEERREAGEPAGLPLPSGLKPQQKDQISRLFAAPSPESRQPREGSHGKQTKR